MSHPTMGAWIEICSLFDNTMFAGSHPTMGAWIEIVEIKKRGKTLAKSHPTMGAWIEIV